MYGQMLSLPIQHFFVLIGMLASEFGKERIKKEVENIVEKCNQKCWDKEKN